MNALIPTRFRMALGMALLVSAMQGRGDERPEIEVFKKPSCGCCRPWIKYMESEGFRIKVNDVPDVHPLKRERGIPKALGSCHTALIDGYVLEGHVSADDVRRLLGERPPIVGLVVPGMPKGAPGMEGPDPVAYDVLALSQDGSVTVYATHRPGLEEPAPASAVTATPGTEDPAAQVIPAAN